MIAELLPFARDEEDAGRLVPISALQHGVYCLRQAALIHVEQQWVENQYTAEGRVLHEKVDSERGRARGALRRVHGLPIGSERLGLVGKCDLVEVQREASSSDAPIKSVFPIEFKRGRAKPHRADEVQLCAQALCLEEMTGVSVRQGALFYAQTKRRVSVSIDSELRALTESVTRELRSVFVSGQTPAPTRHVGRCRRCSLRDTCRPDAVRRPSAKSWMDRRLGDLLDGERT